MADEYTPIVVRLPELTPLDNCDNVAAARIFGLQAIVSVDAVPGTPGIFFPAECQIEHGYLAMNNLYREGDLNSDQTQKGYFEKTRRVRAVKFRGHRSDAFWMPLTSIDEDGTWGEGDYIEGLAVKYIPKGTRGKGQPQQAKKDHRVSEKFFPQHLDTANFFRVFDGSKDMLTGVITQKLHGTSVRVGNVLVKREPKWYEKFVAKLGVKVQTREFAEVGGSRRVTKSLANPVGNDYYDTDIHSLVAGELKGLVPEGYVVYGEIIGWTPGGSPIQKGYTYRIPKGEHELYIYRVAYVNSQGIQADLSWGGVKEFCRERNLKHVPELFEGPLWADDVERRYIDKKFYELDPEGGALPLEKGNPCDEGVVIRIEGITPKAYKAKSPLFLQFETNQLDAEVADMEPEG